MPYSLRFAVPQMEPDRLLATGTATNQHQTNGQQTDQPLYGQTPQPTQQETIYVTMSTKDPERHIHLKDIGHVMMQCLAVVIVLVFALVPDAPRYTTKTLSVPAVFLPVQTITVSVPITATGVKTYPATQAQGVLTITNGGSLTESLQAGFLLTTSSGVEVATDQSVIIPPGNGASYGMATVSAHAVVAGSSGNIPADSIDRTYGTDIFIKNTSAFTGGTDASSVHYITNRDVQAALASAQVRIAAKKPLGLLLKPCAETTSQQTISVSVTLNCQPITYHAPAGMQIVGVRVQGTQVVLTYRAVMNADT